MSVESSSPKLELAAATKEKFGREIRVFETSGQFSSSPRIDETDDDNDDDDDEFYEFTAEDYYRILAANKKKEDNKFLKTKGIREAEEAAGTGRSKFRKAVIIRVRFPDNHTLEVNFHPSETMQSLVDFLRMRVLSRTDVPFYLYTAPPKRIIKDMSQDFYSAGFIPGAIVYFSYDDAYATVAAAANSGPFLREDVMSLKGCLQVIADHQQQPHDDPKPAAEKKSVKLRPKWLKI
ncbi:Plant UBX domain-containing protein 1 [Citrus sinensis]|uniref:plant UBX domain-containing protein 1-like n=1 Tax=Citrus sinensis TaxID=2711 RepID=UPI00218F5E4D|nr:plant UBX domain-containing protein 1-like [Citrus sinensis]KAH9688276.1 Plant UBX domain-containing protein 1 [Citrus sinensis]